MHKYALKWRINGVFDCSGPELNRTRLHVVIFIFACEQEEQQRVGRERERWREEKDKVDNAWQ